MLSWVDAPGWTVNHHPLILWHLNPPPHFLAGGRGCAWKRGAIGNASLHPCISTTTLLLQVGDTEGGGAGFRCVPTWHPLSPPGPFCPPPSSSRYCIVSYLGGSDTRTSRNAWVGRKASGPCESLYIRAANLLGVDEKLMHSHVNAEDMQVGGCPAWKCPTRPYVDSYPGTPTSPPTRSRWVVVPPGNDRAHSHPGTRNALAADPQVVHYVNGQVRFDASERHPPAWPVW